jgi:outer membrane lipoprotein-sorting protein
MKQFEHALELTLILLLSLPVAAAQSPEAKGLSIALEADKRDTGFGDFTADMQMILMNKHGQKSERKIRIRTLEVEADGDKSLTIFDTPRDVKGTAFLNYTHKTGDDDQWLYLPALKRVKRISSRNKSGSFVGSEFAYEDISSQEPEKYTYKWIRDEAFEGLACFVVEYCAVDKKNSGYTKQVAWLDKDQYRVWKVEYYDRKNSRLKTLAMKDYRKYLDKYWRAHEMYMVNHLTGKSTKLMMSNYKFRTGLKDSDFSQNSLRRVR